MPDKTINFLSSQAPSGLSGKIRVPGDKSISHRSIMFGSLAEGVTKVTGFLEGEDSLGTLRAFRDMGVKIEGGEKGEKGNIIVHGVGLQGLKKPQNELDVGNSGTTMRLMSGILAGQSFDVVLKGDNSLSKRPMGRVITPLMQMGAEIESVEGKSPLKIKGSKNKKLTAIHYDLPMASAQVKSCVLLAGLYAEGKTSVTEPEVTRDHTERMLRGFSYPLKVIEEGGGKTTVSLESGGKLIGTNIDVPADISSAAFFMVAASIVPGSDITLQHVGVNPTRTGVIDILKLMGADITLLNQKEVGGEPVADIRIKYSSENGGLTGIQIPAHLVPLAIDEFPVLFIAAVCAQGQTVLSGAEELRVKESDRIQVMADGLKNLGVDSTVTPDGIIIEGGQQIGGGSVETHDDHRIAMAFSVAGLRSSDTVQVNNCGHVATSFPNFVELAQQVGFKLESH